MRSFATCLVLALFASIAPGCASTTGNVETVPSLGSKARPELREPRVPKSGEGEKTDELPEPKKPSEDDDW